MTGFEADSNAATIAAQLRKAAAELSDLDHVNQQAGDLVADAPGPRRTGAAVSSVRATVVGDSVQVAGTVRYWSFAHWGAPRHHQRAQPWLLTYVESHATQLVELYEHHTEEAVSQVEG